MLNINNQVFITLKIDGIAVEYAHIKEITLAEGNGVYAPTLKIELDDPTSELSKRHALSEGNTIEIFIGKSASDPNSKARKYRVFGPTRDNNSYNPNLMVIGLLNCPLYFTASARECTTGTSADALKAIATKVGLTFKGPSKGRILNDKMTWLDVCTTRAQNAFDITRHGYMDDKSCMETIVTSYHEMRYRNLADEINVSPESIKYVFAHSTLQEKQGGKKFYLVKEARDRSSSGVMSSWMNYGSTRSSNHIDGTQRDRKGVDVKTPGAYLAINQEVSEAVKRTRFDYSAIDCTNTHQNYQNANYQNKKLLALFTETMSLLVLEVTDIQLFDALVYRQADGDPNAKVRNEDIYLLIGKTIVVRGGIHYAERLQCIRMSLTMKGSAELKTSMGDDGGQSNSIIPESSINMSGIGGGASSLSSISGINSALSPIQSVSGALSSLTGAVSGISSSAISAVSGLQSAIVGGATSMITSALGTALAPVNEVLSQVTQLSSTVAGLPSMATGLVNSVAAIPQQALTSATAPTIGAVSPIVGAAFSKPGSVTTSVLETVKLTTVYGNIGQQAKSTIATLPTNLKNTAEAIALNAVVNAVGEVLNPISSAVSSTWNTMLAATNGVVAPVTGTINNASGLVVRMTNQMVQPGMTEAGLLDFLIKEALRLVNGNPNWMREDELNPYADSFGLNEPETVSNITSNNSSFGSNVRVIG